MRTTHPTDAKLQISTLAVLALLMLPIGVIAQDEDEQTNPENNDAPSAAQQLLADQLPQNEVNWLSVGGSRALSIYNPDISGTAKGGVITLPGMNRPPTSSYIYNALRKNLSKNQWHSLIVLLPNPDSATAPMSSSGEEAEIIDTSPTEDFATDEEATAAANAEATIETTNGQTLSTRTKPKVRPQVVLGGAEEQAQQTIQAAIDFYNKEGIFNIVIIGEGINALRAAHFIASMPEAIKAQGEINQIRGLAMINPRNTIYGSDLSLPMELSYFKVPIMDIYFGTDFRDERESKARAAVSRGLPGGLYTQIKLPITGNNWQQREDRLTKRLRGWMDRRAAGFEIDAKMKR